MHSDLSTILSTKLSYGLTSLSTQFKKDLGLEVGGLKGLISKITEPGKARLIDHNVRIVAYNAATAAMVTSATLASFALLSFAFNPFLTFSAIAGAAYWTRFEIKKELNGFWIESGVNKLVAYFTASQQSQLGGTDFGLFGLFKKVTPLETLCSVWDITDPTTAEALQKKLENGSISTHLVTLGAAITTYLQR